MIRTRTVSLKGPAMIYGAIPLVHGEAVLGDGIRPARSSSCLVVTLATIEAAATQAATWSPFHIAE